MSPDEIARQRGLKAGTILAHLEKLREIGFEFSLDGYFTPERLETIRGWFRSSDSDGALHLGPAVEASAGGMDYDEARLARLVLMQNQANSK